MSNDRFARMTPETLARLNGNRRWSQGYFVDQPQYRHMHPSWKTEQVAYEQLNVRPAPLESAICRTMDPDYAIWIASRLNFAARAQKVLEALAYDVPDFAEVSSLLEDAARL